jgi:LacI family transcriptional regulator
MAAERVEVAEWFQVEPGFKAASQLLARHPETTAIVAANDLLAIGVLRAMSAAGRSVPDDVSVTGYNDMPYADMIQPALTTVRVPYREMGELAARALLRLMREEGAEVESVRLAPTLSMRASTAPAR